MHRSSKSIAALAAALAKAQMALTNPEKSLTGTVPSNRYDEPGRTFRYAPSQVASTSSARFWGSRELPIKAALGQAPVPTPPAGTTAPTPVPQIGSGPALMPTPPQHGPAPARCSVLARGQQTRGVSARDARRVGAPSIRTLKRRPRTPLAPHRRGSNSAHYRSEECAARHRPKRFDTQIGRHRLRQPRRRTFQGPRSIAPPPKVPSSRILRCGIGRLQ